MLDTTDPDRPKAMLTEDERSGLINDWRGKFKKRKNKSYHQRQIVKRVRHSLLDFSLLCENLPKNRRKEIFDIGHPPENDEEEAKQDAIANDLQDGLIDTIAFMYLLLESDHHSAGTHDQIRQLTFQRVLESGVSKAEKHLGEYEWPWIPNIDVRFDVEVNEISPTDVDRAIDKIAEGRAVELSDSEARQLLLTAEQSEYGSQSFLNGWKDLGEQIAERREERDGIVTREELEEFAELPDDKVRERLKEKRSTYEEYKQSKNEE